MSTTGMQRTESASSSATAHPLDHGAEEPKASSSSTSSSPTFRSNSSSAHRTSSTLASSLQTAGSHSSFQASSGNKILLHEGSTVPSAFVRPIGQMNGTQRSLQNVEGKANEEARSRVLAKTPLWEERRYTELDEDSYSAQDEQSPIKYPPFSEEEQEARRIEQKLEQWAVQEKSRRKAKRSSRTASVLLTTSNNTGRFGKRMSALGQMANSSSGRSQLSQSTLTEPTPAAFDDAYGNTTATVNGAVPYAKRNSIGSTDALVGGSLAFRDASASVTDLRSQKEDSVDSSADSEAIFASRRKGKGKEVSDPFQDPQPPPSSYGKPSARRPIVTPGRAPTIRHRALAQARTQDKEMPAIVASDADEEREARHTLDRFNTLEDDPFQSASERATAAAAAAAAAADGKTKEQRPTIKTNVSSYTIGSTVEDRSPDTPKRKSTNSRFNEIGLDNEEDAAGWPMDDSGGESKEATPRLARGRKNAYNGNTMMDRTQYKSDVGSDEGDQEHSSRAPWWTEWLCGCGPPTDADLEQSGRTFPE